MLGRRMDRVRDDDETETALDQDRDETAPGTEQP